MRIIYYYIIYNSIELFYGTISLYFIAELIIKIVIDVDCITRFIQ